MSQPFRRAAGGRIDRARTLRFRFDDRELQGHPGDTLASALLANGVRLVGRSFKYHRPRGIYTAGAEEPNALVELRTGTRQEPNTRATTIELFDGLEARSQNRWPSLRVDLHAVSQLAGTAIAAGFYYKTFMWPASFWERVYEPLIRRTAGLGRATAQPDPDRYERVHAHADVLVVGAGPAGLAAALAAAHAGARVIVCEQDFELGGSLLCEPAQESWRAAIVGALSALPEVRLLPRTTVFGCYDHNMLGAVERVADHLPEPPSFMPRQRVWQIRARQVVLAAGAHERLIAFPGNDRPGVMLAGAVGSYATRFGVYPGARVLLFANNDHAYAALFSLQDTGAAIAGAVDPRPTSTAIESARARGITVWQESEVAATLGGLSLRGARVRRRGASGYDHVVAADVLMVSGGYNPAAHLASQSRTPLVWDDGLATFVPGVPAQPQYSAGAAAGVFGVAAAARDGARAGADAARAAGHVDDPSVPLPEGEVNDVALLPLWDVRGKMAFVDLQDDVTADDIRLAHREGYRHIEHAKRYTTHTMGTDQGKTGGLVGAAVLAAARGDRIEAVGLPRFRPFTTPVTWGALAGPHVGRDYAPIRRTALNDWHARHGADFMEAGLWLRPALYRRDTDADAWTSILREAGAVRRAVGLCDVSTLGKIDVQGADAGTFLDRIYANTVSTLAIGHVRYGLMLREDGIAFDDGTISRLHSEHFFITTTTANAGPVMAHLEFYLQTEWPELDVQLISATDQWAAMSLAGPNARLVLERVVGGVDVSHERFPFMTTTQSAIGGYPVRLFRISFSGELAYEIATPAGFAEYVWQALLEAGAELGITPYGVEALNLLRIEKGHVAGPELNGQTTAHDLGLGRMLKRRGDFVGRMLATRPGLVDPARPRLVGLRPVDPTAQLRAGAQLVEPGARESLGHVTSATRSVEPGGWIALALLSDAPARLSTRLHAVYPLRDSVVEVMVTTPHMFDPENTRVRS
jgi:sarcosine oxidase subunit alpha